MVSLDLKCVSLNYCWFLSVMFSKLNIRYGCNLCGSPEKLCVLHPWKCPGPGWMGLGETWDGGGRPCPWEGVGARWSLKSFQIKAFFMILESSFRLRAEDSNKFWSYSRKHFLKIIRLCDLGFLVLFPASEKEAKQLPQGLEQINV